VRKPKCEAARGMLRYPAYLQHRPQPKSPVLCPFDGGTFVPIFRPATVRSSDSVFELDTGNAEQVSATQRHVSRSERANSWLVGLPDKSG
jgi:hypothetical protein